MNDGCATPQDAEYQRLAAEYRHSVVRCLVCLEELRVAESAFNTLAKDLGRDTQRGHAMEELTRALLMFGEREVQSPRPEIEGLSERELEVFVLIGEGRSSREIATQLHIAISTVETYRERLKDKLRVGNGHALTRLATIWALSRRLAAPV